MHVLYIHKNFPAQFGHLGCALARRRGWKVTFLSEKPDFAMGPIRRIQFRVRGGATRKSHFACASLENYIWNSHAVYNALKAHPEVRPDIIVSHSGFGTTLFLRQLYDVSIVHFCEWYYRQEGSDTDFFPCRQNEAEVSAMRSRGRNAMLLADLENCTLGYSPTHWQRSRLPHEYQYKLETIFDGIDTDFWRPHAIRNETDRTIAGKKLPDGKKIVTYVSRGFESMRGFDVFMQIAREICNRRKDVVFLCIGSDRVCYSGDLARIPEKSFREHVLKRGTFDLERFIFTGTISGQELAKALSYSDLHIFT
jgi:glycosyltransferase involved in cell wall biosynthesis